MRITQQMLHQNSVRNMNQTLNQFEKTNNQVSTGKLLHRPSDNPNGVSQAMNLKSAIAANSQYERNTGEARLWLEETDQTVNQMVGIMQRIREIAVKGSNGTLTETDRTAIAIEVDELAAQLSEFADSELNGKALFEGLKKFTISDGVVVKANVSKEELLTDPKGIHLLGTLNELSENLRSKAKVDLTKIDSGIGQLLGTLAEVGARTNRVEAVENRLKDSTLILKSMLSTIEDVDYAEAIIKLKSEESIYQASLASSAKIIQPTLMDFLR